MKKLFVALLGLLLTASTALAGTVTITGNVIDNYGNPAVGLRVVEYPLKWTIAGGSLVMPNPVSVSTNSSGNWSMTVEGGLLAAIFVPPSGNIPYGLIQATLPTSGTVTYATLAAQQPNVLTAFPPLANLNMGGFGFTNMAGATAAGGAMAYGSGLGGPQLFIASGTFTIPTNTTLIRVLLVAPGGGGGGGSATGGGGAGAGEILSCLVLPAQGSGAVTIGAFGTGGANGVNGTDATDTTFVQSNGPGATCDAGGGKKGATAGTHGAGGNAATEISGAAVQEYVTIGADGTDGSGGTPGVGGSSGGPGGGGNGAASGNAGANGNPGYVLVIPF